MTEAISHVLGGLCMPIPSEILLDQGRVRNSAGPSPDVMMLKGRRIVFASETDEGRRLSASRVKWLTGGDSLVGRQPFDKHPTSFTPSHQLFLLTNKKPRASAADFALWERIHLIPFELSFVDREPKAENERPADKQLLEKLKSEASGILSWLIRGCLRYQDQEEGGLRPPAIVREATFQYRRQEDTLIDFLEECCDIDPAESAGATDLFEAFRLWSGLKWSQRAFGDLMTERFEKKRDGIFKYFGLSLNLEWGQKIENAK
jgi:putative DNA primase/helicase